MSCLEKERAAAELLKQEKCDSLFMMQSGSMKRLRTMRSPSSDPSGHLPRPGGKADSVRRNTMNQWLPWSFS